MCDVQTTFDVGGLERIVKSSVLSFMFCKLMIVLLDLCLVGSDHSLARSVGGSEALSEEIVLSLQRRSSEFFSSEPLSVGFTSDFECCGLLLESLLGELTILPASLLVIMVLSDGSCDGTFESYVLGLQRSTFLVEALDICRTGSS